MRSWLWMTFVLGVCWGPLGARGDVQIVLPEKLSGPAAYGIEKLEEAFCRRGETVQMLDRLDQADASHVVVAGLATCEPVQELVERCGLEVPMPAESLAVGVLGQRDQRVVVLGGRDAIGLLYAALDTADRVGWTGPNEDPFTHIQPIAESPFLQDRSVSTYTMHRGWWEQRLYDERYWQRYFDLLARSRINSFVIIFGYECGGFMAPPYPYFFDVPGFPEVQIPSLTDKQQAKNTEALRRVLGLAHARGIRVTVGIWDHIYRGRVQTGGMRVQDTSHLVEGLTADKLAPYTKAALKEFLHTFPDLDAIQFRMHWESGLTREETPGFWQEVFEELRALSPHIRFDLRAKGLPDEVIEDAIRNRLPFRITTKYWMEQMGLPFHPTHVNPGNQHDRRHGYADLLRYPKRYDMHWRMWNGGTARFLLWGSPEYVRRFAQSCRIYDGRSFEVNEMLATKMLGAEHTQKSFALHNPPYRHYDYEFERYWHFYQLWGRVSYNPNVSPEIWQREFTRRFGAEAGPHVMKGLHTASSVLPAIVAAAYNYTYFPTTRGWAEMMPFGPLATYAQGTGTDTEQFQSYEEAAEQLLAGQFTTLRSPFQNSRWFSQTADRILEEVRAAQDASPKLEGNAVREFRAALTDLSVLAHLARFHAARMKAAVWYNVYQKTKDRFARDRCVQFETEAVRAWEDIVRAAGDVYPENLQFGVHRVGFPHHWNEELEELRTDLVELKDLSATDKLDDANRRRLVQHEKTASAEPQVQVRVERAASATPGRDLAVSAEVRSSLPLEYVRLRYRHLTQFEDYETAEMQLDAKSGRYVGTIPGSFIVPEWDVMYFVEVLPENGPGTRAPDFRQEMPYVILPVERVP